MAWYDDLLRGAKQLGAIPAGALGAPGDLANLLSNAAGYGTPFAGMKQIEQMAGVPPPQNSWEDFSMRTMENLGGLLMPGVGSGGKVALAGRELLAAPAAAAGAMGGQQLAQGTPYAPIAELLGGVAGGVGGAMAPEMLRSRSLGNQRGAVGPLKPPQLPGPEEVGPLWRDNIIDALDELKQDKLTPDQLRAHLRNYRGTTDQAKWIGLDDFLEGKKGVTRGEVEDFVRGNGLEVEEVVLGEPNRWLVKYSKPGAEPGRPAFPGVDSFDTQAEAIAHAEQVEKQLGRPAQVIPDTKPGTQAKYKEYQTEGGENYRELLITLPPASSLDKYMRAHAERLGVDYSQIGSWKTPSNVDIRDSLFSKIQDKYGEAELSKIGKLEDATPEAYRDPHFQQPNVLAHIRFNERILPDGRRMLFIEEIQSDWHQRGAKQGYGPTGPETFDVHDAADEWLGNYATREIAERELANYRQRVGTEDGFVMARRGKEGVPDAPFKKTWPLLAMKRMIRWAAENGFDEVGWTTGQMQNKRANKELKNIVEVYREQGQPKHAAIAKLQDDRRVPLSSAQLAEVERLSGRKAQPIAELRPNSEGFFWDFKEKPLELSSEKLPNFYDRELVNDTNKFVKKWGAKVVPGEAPVEKAPTVILDANKRARLEEIASGGVVKLPGKTVGPDGQLKSTGFTLKKPAVQEALRNVVKEIGEKPITVGDLHKKIRSALKSDAIYDTIILDNIGITSEMRKGPKTDKVWSLKITPQLKKAALRGMELSSLTRDSAVG